MMVLFHKCKGHQLFWKCKFSPKKYQIITHVIKFNYTLYSPIKICSSRKHKSTPFHTDCPPYELNKWSMHRPTNLSDPVMGDNVTWNMMIPNIWNRLYNEHMSWNFIEYIFIILPSFLVNTNQLHFKHAVLSMNPADKNC